MKPTRRTFLKTSGAGLTAVGLTRSIGGAQTTPSSSGTRLQGAPGVELMVQDTALPDYSHDLQRYLVRLASEARARRQKIISAISTRQQVLDRQKAVVQELWTMLGGPLERGPLNPRVTGVVERPGYRIEKLYFESRPRLYVTANLYVPARAGRRPAILGPLGHSQNGKAWPSYQKLFTNLARKGYVVLAYDPFGQGERIEYPGARTGVSALGGGTSEHEHAGRRLILLGANFGLFRAWDGIRGIDYLLTRPEVDPERLGCCGQSGGGTLTQFLAALDDRIRVAVRLRGQHRESGARRRRASRIGRRRRAEHRPGARARHRSRGSAVRVCAETAADDRHAARCRSHLLAGIRRQRTRAARGIQTGVRTARGR